MPTKPPIKLSDASPLQAALRATDLLVGLGRNPVTQALSNATWTAQTVADFVKQQMGGGAVTATLTTVRAQLAATPPALSAGSLYAITGTQTDDANPNLGTWNSAGVVATVYVQALSSSAFDVGGALLQTNGTVVPVSVNVAAGTYVVLDYVQQADLAALPGNGLLWDANARKIVVNDNPLFFNTVSVLQDRQVSPTTGVISVKAGWTTLNPVTVQGGVTYVSRDLSLFYACYTDAGGIWKQAWSTDTAGQPQPSYLSTAWMPPNGVGVQQVKLVVSVPTTDLPLLHVTPTQIYSDTAIKARIVALEALGGRFRGPWVASTAYKQYDQVVQGGAFYYANAAFTSAATFDATKWTAISTGGSGTPAPTTGGVFRGLHAATTAYKQYDEILQAGVIYYASADFTSGAAFDATKWTVLDAVLTLAQVQALIPLASPVQVQANDGLHPFTTLLDGLNYNGHTLRINTQQVTLTDTNSRSRPVVLSDYAQILVANGAVFQLNSGASVVTTDVSAVGSSGTGTAAVIGSWDGTARNATQLESGVWSLPILLDNNAISLRRNAYVASVLGSGTLFLYDSAGYGTAGPGITVIDRRPGAATTGSANVLYDAHYTASAAGAQPVITQAGAAKFFNVTVAGDELTRGTHYTDDGAGNLTILAAAGVVAGDVVQYCYLTGSLTSAPAQPSGADIDYANPVTLTGATTLAARKSYNVTGAGYALTLPSGVIGDTLFVSISSTATGVYAIGSGLSLISGEAAELLKTSNGWIKKSGPRVTVFAKIRTAAGNPSLTVNGFYYLPFTGGLSANSTQSLPNMPGVQGLLSLDGRSLVVPRDGKATINASGVLEGLAPNSVYAVCLIANPPGQSGNNVLAQVLATGGTAVPFLPVTDFFVAGTYLTVAIYADGAGNLRNAADSDRFYLTYSEL